MSCNGHQATELTSQCGCSCATSGVFGRRDIVAPWPRPSIWRPSRVQSRRADVARYRLQGPHGPRLEGDADTAAGPGRVARVKGRSLCHGVRTES
jgi:hypothetical protein